MGMLGPDVHIFLPIFEASEALETSNKFSLHFILHHGLRMQC